MQTVARTITGYLRLDCGQIKDGRVDKRGLASYTYNYTIRTGSYPQIIHAESEDVTGGRITCMEFVDINGKRHEGWIPAIRLS